MVAVPRDRPPVVSWWESEVGSGTPIVWANDREYSWIYFGGQHPCATSDEALSSGWIRRLLRDPHLATKLSGAFALIVVDKQTGRTVIIGDRLGVQGVHHSTDTSGTWRASTHLSWLLLANHHDGAVDEQGFLTHMAFGYGVDPHRSVYLGVQAVAAGGYVEFADGQCTTGVYWEAPEPSPLKRLEDSSFLAATLGSAMQWPTHGGPLFLGITGGKDSLCLASTVRAETRPSAGTLGMDGSADQVQGAQICQALNWQHIAGGVCTTPAFFEWADYIAFASAGLCTASYADMAAFVANLAPPMSTFVIGEGGECVRDFFHAVGRAPLQRLADDYMTPVGSLRITLSSRLAAELDGYPWTLIARLRSAIADERDDAGFASYFYRYQRMPGNFSLRHAVLSSIRPKLSPFLDSNFIDATYGLSTSEHMNSEIHRRIIAAAKPSLEHFFTSPVQTAVSTQEWPARFPTFANPFRERLQQMLPASDDVLDPGGVLELCDAASRNPRAVYHLFRVYSFVAARAILRREAVARLAAITARRVELPWVAAARQPSGMSVY
jgi:hypothetical protein